MTWPTPSPIRLAGNHIVLEPLQPGHRNDLIQAASDGELWQLWYTGVPSPDDADSYIEKALQQQAEGRALPFVVRHIASNRIIGSTRFCNIEPAHRRLEIGYTWYGQSYQRTPVNSEAKFLLLRHAFEHLNCIAVEFRTHWLNHRSRAAIARLGAKQDGVLRNHIIMPDGSYRDTVVFSIIESEWPMIKQHLQFILSR
jgi:RimJ/RimL family protein N-acetyltransferase